MKMLQKMVAGTLMLCILTLGAAGVSAYDAEGRFRAFGPANESCSDYKALRDRKLPGHSMAEQEAIDNAVEYWISGWVTTWNYVFKDTYDVTGGYKFDDVVEQIEKFCERSPNKKLIDALIIVTRALYPYRLKHEPAMKSNEPTAKSN